MLNLFRHFGPLCVMSLLLGLSTTACGTSQGEAPAQNQEPQSSEQYGVRDRAEAIRARAIDGLHAATTLNAKIPHAVKYFETIEFNVERDETSAIVFLEEFFQLVRDNFTSFGLYSVSPDLQGVQTLMALATAMDEAGRRNATSVLEMIEEALKLPRNAEPSAYQQVIIENRQYAAYLLHLRLNSMAYQALVALDPGTLELPRRALFPHRVLLLNASSNVIRDCTKWLQEATRLRTLMVQLRLRNTISTPVNRRYKRLYLAAGLTRTPRARAERALLEIFDRFVEPIRPDRSESAD